MKRFVPKTGFSIVFLKIDLDGGDSFYRQNFYLKKQNTPDYAQVSVLMCPKLNSVTVFNSMKINEVENAFMTKYSWFMSNNYNSTLIAATRHCLSHFRPGNYKYIDKLISRQEKQAINIGNIIIFYI